MATRSLSANASGGDRVDLLTGGTQPAEHVHEEVIDVMDEAGFDLSDRTPRGITIDDLRSCDYVATIDPN